LFPQGDEVEITVRPVVRPKFSSAYMTEDVIDGDVTLTIGHRANKPNSGFWYLECNGDKSELLEYDIDAKELENMLNMVPSIVTLGGVRVAQVHGDGYKIAFEGEGEVDSLVGYGDGLSPVSGVNVVTVTEGAESVRAVYWIQLRQLPVSVTTSAWQSEPAVIASATQIKPAIHEIALSGKPKDGYFAISLNAGPAIQISVFSSPEDIEGKLGAGYSVSKSGDYGWVVEKDDKSPFTLAVTSSSNIASFSGKKATVLLDYGLCAELLTGSVEANTFLQITVSNEDSNRTILQTPCIIASKPMTQ
jgi:hypothetical protein